MNTGKTTQIIKYTEDGDVGFNMDFLVEQIAQRFYLFITETPVLIDCNSPLCHHYTDIINKIKAHCSGGISCRRKVDLAQSRKPRLDSPSYKLRNVDKS